MDWFLEVKYSYNKWLIVRKALPELSIDMDRETLEALRPGPVASIQVRLGTASLSRYQSSCVLPKLLWMGSFAGLAPQKH